jgi:phosphohistidine phosphatase
MKRLYLMRHARALKADGGNDDGRALSEQGRQDAEKTGKRIATLDPAPTEIICSSALRAAETAAIAAEAVGTVCRIEEDAALYTATAEEYLEVIIRRAEDDAVMLVAHNPSMEQLAAHFERSGAGMGTCVVAWFDFDIRSWRKLKAESGPVNTGRLYRE